jgi:hypothetical protein
MVNLINDSISEIISGATKVQYICKIKVEGK